MAFVGGLVAMGLFWVVVGATGVESLSFRWWLVVAGSAAIGLAINIATARIRRHRDD